jgi:hypothetical protein
MKVKEEMIGKRFNRLTVLEHHSREKGYLCQCDCGNTTIARGNTLKSGRHASCGCLMREKIVERQEKPNFEGLKHEIYRNYKKSSIRRNYEFELTPDEFYNFLDGNCHYCGLEPNMSWKGTKRKSMDTSEFKVNGVDRVDNKLGYIIENCVSCCKFCNNSKSTMDANEFLENIQRVYTFQKVQ